MKIAMISTIPAYPTVAGNCERIRTLIAEIVAQGHELHFFFLPPFRAADFDLAAHEAVLGGGRAYRLEKRFEERVNDFVKFGIRDRFRQIKRTLHIGERHRKGIDDLYSSAFNRLLREHDAREHFDTVIVEYVFSSAAFGAFPEAGLKILDTHDSFSDRHLRFSDGDYWFSTSEKEQVRAFQRANVVVAIQDEEADLFRTQLGFSQTSVRTVSHIMPTGGEVASYGSGHATFLGSANPANISAIGAFMAETLPRILAEVPDFKLHLAGSISSAVPDHPSVLKLGRVEKVVDAFSLGPISINPVGAGTGINIKLLDSMACGVPTVCTETGCRGMPARFLRGIVRVADNDPKAFADAVVGLSRSAETRAAIGKFAVADARVWNAEQSRALTQVLARG